MSKCEHRQFQAAVQVARLTDERGNLKRFSADVTIRCSECGTRFQFQGMPAGFHPDHPCVSADGLEARMPIAPHDCEVLREH